MSRTQVSLLAAVTFLTPVLLRAQHASHLALTQAAAAKPNTAAPKKNVAAPKQSNAQKIADALSAAPAEIAKSAAVMDWPDTPTGQPKELRAGTNGWMCYPSSPGEFKGASIADPMCMDKEWQKWGEAWMSKAQPKVSGTGIAYMLRGDKGASNTDPFATGPTATNQWVVSPPHIMVLYADLKVLDAFPADPKTGGPWVMWKGTPYAHLMVPVSGTKAATMPSVK